MLKVPIEFIEDALIWDADDHLELVRDDAGIVKKDYGGNVLTTMA